MFLICLTGSQLHRVSFDNFENFLKIFYIIDLYQNHRFRSEITIFQLNYRADLFSSRRKIYLDNREEFDPSVDDLSIAPTGRGSAIKIGFSSILGRPSLKVFETVSVFMLHPECGLSSTHFSPVFLWHCNPKITCSTSNTSGRKHLLQIKYYYALKPISRLSREKFFHSN